jgi:hypothetical protein
MRWINSLSEKPVHHRLRILEARINLTGVTRGPLGGFSVVRVSHQVPS